LNRSTWIINHFSVERTDIIGYFKPSFFVFGKVLGYSSEGLLKIVSVRRFWILAWIWNPSNILPLLCPIGTGQGENKDKKVDKISYWVFFIGNRNPSNILPHSYPIGLLWTKNDQGENYWNKCNDKNCKGINKHSPSLSNIPP
jgi:hypothetical protein